MEFTLILGQNQDYLKLSLVANRFTCGVCYGDDISWNKHSYSLKSKSLLLKPKLEYLSLGIYFQSYILVASLCSYI